MAVQAFGVGGTSGSSIRSGCGEQKAKSPSSGRPTLLRSPVAQRRDAQRLGERRFQGEQETVLRFPPAA